MQGRSNNTSAGIQRHVCLTPRKSPQLGSQAAETLVVLPSLKYIHFLFTVPVCGSDIFFVFWKTGTFMFPPPHLCFTQSNVIYCKWPLHCTELAGACLVPLTTLQRARHGHNKDHCLIYSLCTRMKQVLILAEKVSLSC